MGMIGLGEILNTDSFNFDLDQRLISQIGGKYRHNKSLGERDMKEEVAKVLEKVRPALQADGGDVELIDVQDGIVSVRLTGACGGSPMSQMTLKQGIERAIREAVPGIRGVESVDIS